MPYSSAGFLAIDAGTHAVRAAVFLDGQMVTVVSESLELVKHDNGYIEQDPIAMANALRLVCCKAIASAQGHPLVAVMAAQRSSVLAWDSASAKPLSAILSWQDTRGQAQLLALKEELNGRIHELTGLQPSAHYGATKLAWMKSHLVLPADAMLGPLAAWLVSQLTGTTDTYPCDHVNAARTLLLNRKTMSWDNALCQAFGVDASQLPNPVNSVFEYGNITLEGLAPVPLVAVMGDQNAAYIAMRYGQWQQPFKSPLVVNIGSGAFILGATEQNSQTASTGLLTSLAFSRLARQDWLLEGTVNGAGTTITRWVQQLKGALSEESLFQQLPIWLDDQSLNIPVCVDTQVGLGSPFWRLHKHPCGVCFYGAKGGAITPSIPEQAVAVIESIVFLIAANVFQMQKAGGVYDVLLVAGGLSRVKGLVARLGDLIAMPCLVSSCHEATLQGAAVLASDFTFKPVLNGDYLPPTINNARLHDRYQHYIQHIDKCL